MIGRPEVIAHNTRVYTGWRADLLAYIGSFGIPTTEREDVLHEVWLAMPSDVEINKPWLFHVAGNRSRDWLRKRKARAEDPLDLADNVAEPGDAYEQAGHRSAILAAFDKLSDDTFDACYLHFIRGLTQTEIGDRMNLSQPTVSRLLAAGRQVLIETLTQEDVLP